MVNDTTQPASTTTPFAQIPNWVILEPTLSGNAIKVYGILATYADNQTRMCFPGQESITKHFGKDIRTVKRAMKELVDFGAVFVAKRGYRTSNRYWLPFHGPYKAGDVLPDYVDTESKHHQKYGDTYVPSVGAPMSHELDSADPHSDSYTSVDPFHARTSSSQSVKTNPGDLDEPTRKRLRDKLVPVGKARADGHTFYDDETQYHWERFTDQLEEEAEHHHVLESVLDIVMDQWSVTADVATPYGAGGELNTMISFAIKHPGGRVSA